MSLTMTDTNLVRPNALIDGQWMNAASGETYAVTNPATGTVLANVAYCGAAESKAAIAAAAKAFASWSRTPAKQRSALLMAWYDLLIAHQDDLAQLLCAEQGKPYAEALGEILYGASYIQWFAEEAKRIYGDVIAAPSQDSRLLVIKQPIGVVACITPWNFPNAMLARKIAPALAAGCTVVCKPANETPLSAMAIGELARRAGIPAGVVNILSGNTQEIGAELTANPDVRKLTFTGSIAVGKKLMADCAATMKRVSMELGGNAPFIVFESADLDQAVKGLIANKFRNAGQTCVCTNRVLVQSSIADVFVEKLTAATGALVMGNGMDRGVTLGPLISRKAVQKITALLDDAREAGADVTRGAHAGDLGENFMPPTIVRCARTDIRLFHEEIFGPVAAVFEFETEEEAVRLANATPYGLAAYFYAQDPGQMWRVAENIEAGMVGINQAALSGEMIPFGGVKESGLGREGSKYGLDDYLEIKHLNFGGIANV